MKLVLKILQFKSVCNWVTHALATLGGHMVPGATLFWHDHVSDCNSCGDSQFGNNSMLIKPTSASKD